ncbi:cytochrome C biogenesis protein [Stenotrophomonas pictorum JCM 9942]|uniref:Cytochrome C biogenesis protein n=2 Tax=Stenotrophomonas pictorum TaxID=86184 RepID=A0A0R0AP64_9GAMM|nr:tetratricopeptide repeat protein [Stenotrophomonas pictorum]KRG42721.1 cytochrome C biogenesis protein [Stenotrophomonas pictorum JCM 9942]
MVSGLFLALAGLLAAVAGGWMLWPLLRAGKRGIWGTLVAAMVVATIGLYQWLGTPAALQPQARAAAAPQTLEEGITQLQAALEKNPERADGWTLLARSQLELGRVAEAAAAYERAVQLMPDEPALLVEAAQTRAQAEPSFLFDETGLRWLQHARTLAPDNERAIWLIGIAQRQRGQAEQAARTWESLLPRLQPAAAAALQEQIAAARAAAGPAADGPAGAAPAASGAGLQVRVTLTPALATRATSRNDTLFVIARVPGGPPMPVAVERHPAPQQPLTVVLDDTDSPMPTAKLSSLRQVEVFARLSQSGTAIRQNGDIESAPVIVTLPADAPVELLLDLPSRGAGIGR